MSVDLATNTQHPNLDTLLAYYAQQLPKERAEAIQEHLVDCASCLEQFLEIQSFEGSLEDLPDPALDTVRKAGWNRLEAAVAAEPSTLAERLAPIPEAAPVSVEETQSLPSTSLTSSRWISWATAAGLAALTLGIVFGTLHYRGELTEVGARLETSLEEQNRLAEELQALSAAAKNPSTLLALAIRPAFLVRNANQPQLLGEDILNEVKLEPEEDSIEVRVELPAEIAEGEVLFLLRDEAGRVLESEVRPGCGIRGDLGTAVELRVASSGVYELEVLSLGVGDDKAVAEFRIELRKR